MFFRTSPTWRWFFVVTPALLRGTKARCGLYFNKVKSELGGFMGTSHTHNFPSLSVYCDFGLIKVYESELES